jgi:putative transposase
MAERDDAQTAADLVCRACLRERIGQGLRQPGNLAGGGRSERAPGQRSATITPTRYPFRTVEDRPDYPRRGFRSQDHACRWACASVDGYNHRHRHSGIRFVTPDQRHSGDAVAICCRRATPAGFSRRTTGSIH